MSEKKAKAALEQTRRSGRGSTPAKANQKFACPHCGSWREREYVHFPPTLARKFGSEGVWHNLPCTGECEAEQERQEWAREQRRKTREILKQRSNLPERLACCRLETFDPEGNQVLATAHHVADKYLWNWPQNRARGKGLLFEGPVGSGKTHLAVAIMQELVEEQGVPGLFVTVPAFVQALRKSDDETELKAAMNAELLVLDDLGAEKPSEWTNEKLFVLLNHRYSHGLPTLITTNLDPRYMSEHLGDRNASRIVGMCDGVTLSGKDRRFRR